jgi:hypothetical protein
MAEYTPAQLSLNSRFAGGQASAPSRPPPLPCGLLGSRRIESESTCYALLVSLPRTCTHRLHRDSEGITHTVQFLTLRSRCTRGAELDRSHEPVGSELLDEVMNLLPVRDASDAAYCRPTNTPP